jgi:hypothetical protein
MNENSLQNMIDSDNPDGAPEPMDWSPTILDERMEVDDDAQNYLPN